MELLWLLLPIAAASGWWAAKREEQWQHASQSRHNADYFRGLNYLLEDEADKAIEVFVKMVEVDRDTAETHLALASLFRRRGEVDRAIHIHRNLIARSNLTPEQRSKALLELGEDYVRAGLFDRAETLYRELAEDVTHAPLALARLAQVYEQEKDWHQAIACYERLEQLTGQSRRLEIAHFHCELAEEALRAGDIAAASALVRQALTRHAECVRASMLAGCMAMQCGDYAAAIEALRRVERQNPRYLPEIIQPLARCYSALGREAEFTEFLRGIQRQDPSGLLSAALAENLREREGVEAALAFLDQELRVHPSFKGLTTLVELRLASDKPPQRSDLEALYRIGQQLFNGSARYKCDNCGFVGKALHWRCPSCKAWGSIKPLSDITCKNMP